MLNKIGRYLNVLNALNLPLFFLDLDRVILITDIHVI